MKAFQNIPATLLLTTCMTMVIAQPAVSMETDILGNERSRWMFIAIEIYEYSKDSKPGPKSTALYEKIICYGDKFYSKSGDTTAEKPLDRVRASMACFGADSLARFDSLTTPFRRV